MPVLRVRTFSTDRINRWIGFLVFFIVWLTMTSAQQPVAREYEIKAVFLFNFTQFVEWPEDVFNSPEQPFVIGVLGDDPFGPFLDETVKNEKVGTHPIEVKRFTSPEEISKCHILFVLLNNKQATRQVLGKISESPVLTVSDMNDFARMGGVIGFFTEGARIRLRVNVASADKAGITISSKLLRLAEIVQSNSD